MIHTATVVAVGVTLGILAAMAIELLINCLVDRSITRERAELARHQALPPVPPEAWTGETIQLAPADVARPLPRDLRYRGHTLRIVVSRRRRHP